MDQLGAALIAGAAEVVGESCLDEGGNGVFCVALTGLEFFGGAVPRAMPWVVELRPIGAL